MNAPAYNFAYLDEQTKRMIRRAILKAIAIPGYQVPFASREMPMPQGWGTGGVQVTASIIGPDDILKVIDPPEQLPRTDERKGRNGEVLKGLHPTIYVHNVRAVWDRMVEAQQGKSFDGKTAIESLRGFSWKSPRGPVTIDANTREPIENYYIRRVEKKDGKLQNVVVKTLEGVKPPGVK